MLNIDGVIKFMLFGKEFVLVVLLVFVYVWLVCVYVVLYVVLDVWCDCVGVLIGVKGSVECF